MTIVQVQLGRQTVPVQIFNTTLGGVRALSDAAQAVDIDSRARKAANGSDFASPEGVTQNLQFLAAGTGAKQRSLRARLRDTVSVFDFDGVVGDGVNDDAPGLRAAIVAASGRELYWPAPPVRFRCASPLGELAYTRFRGDGRRYVQIRKDYSGGPLLTLMDSAEVIGLQFDGQGATRTGQKLFVPNGQRRLSGPLTGRAASVRYVGAA